MTRPRAVLVILLASAGTAAINTDHVRPTHGVRRVLLRQVAILNDINPF